MAGKIDTSRNAPEEVNAYLADLPEKDRAALQAVRDTIKKAVPGITERVAYRMPVFRRNRDFLAFAGHKHHLSLYTMSPGLLENLRPGLAGFETVGTTIHFTPAQPIPHAVMEEIIRRRIMEDDVHVVH